jgi:hypothetical protein
MLYYKTQILWKVIPPHIVPGHESDSATSGENIAGEGKRRP